MAKLDGVSAAHVYAPGHGPDEYTGAFQGLVESVFTIAPAIIVFLVILLWFMRARDKALNRSEEGLPLEKRVELAELRALKAEENRQEVRELRKQRQGQAASLV
jgi:hypothetical protein